MIEIYNKYKEDPEVQAAISQKKQEFYDAKEREKNLRSEQSSPSADGDDTENVERTPEEYSQCVFHLNFLGCVLMCSSIGQQASFSRILSVSSNAGVARLGCHTISQWVARMRDIRTAKSLFISKIKFNS